jgi:hypothetical protein
MEKKRKQIDIDRIVAFRNQINRVSKNTPGAEEVKKLYLTLSDDAIELLMDFAVATCGLDLNASKAPLLVSSLKVDRQDRLMEFLRTTISIQLDSFLLPRLYKNIAIDFLVQGYKKENEQKIVRKLVLYYIRIDRELEEFSWVDYDYIDTLMKRTQKDEREGINNIHRDYFIGLYENGHKVVKRILELTNAIGAGRQTHNLLRRLAKDDRYANVPEYPSDEEQSKKDKWLFFRLARIFDLGLQPITRKEAIKQINAELGV